MIVLLSMKTISTNNMEFNESVSLRYFCSFPTDHNFEWLIRFLTWKKIAIIMRIVANPIAQNGE